MKNHFLDRYSHLESPIHSLDARVKVIAFVSCLVICVTTPPGAYHAFLGYFLCLLILAALSRVPLAYIVKRSLVVVPFVLFIALFLPFKGGGALDGPIPLGIGRLTVYRSGLILFSTVLIKAYISVLSIILLSSTTSFSKLLEGLERLKFPPVLVMITGFTYRYVFVVADEVFRMKRAGDSRGFGGKWIWNSRVIGEMIGTLFLRSYERGERIYTAMQARGFEGRTAAHSITGLGWRDVFFMIFIPAYFLTIRLILR